MQVRPGTAGDIVPQRGEPFSSDQLSIPAYNLEYGQSYLEYLRGHHGTGGLLPKVSAAYNAGPVPLSVWNSPRFRVGDPSLSNQSIPFWAMLVHVPNVHRQQLILPE